MIVFRNEHMAEKQFIEGLIPDSWEVDFRCYKPVNQKRFIYFPPRS